MLIKALLSVAITLINPSFSFSSILNFSLKDVIRLKSSSLKKLKPFKTSLLFPLDLLFKNNPMVYFLINSIGLKLNEILPESRYSLTVSLSPFESIISSLIIFKENSSDSANFE